jgi:hypothetical protein
VGKDNRSVLFLFYTAKTEKEPKRPKLVADALLCSNDIKGLNSANSLCSNSAELFTAFLAGRQS